MADPERASIAVETRGDTLHLKLAGHLSAMTLAELWTSALEPLAAQPARVVVDASGVTYCDGAGVALLVELRLRQGQHQGSLEVRDLAPELARLLEPYEEFAPPDERERETVSFPTAVGRVTNEWIADLRAHVAFLGELVLALIYGLTHLRRLRIKDALQVAERAGASAVPIIALMTFLVGLIMGFQSAVSMRPYGTEIYVPNLVALTIVRELGPLLTAIILAGRTGSAFAAEIGTMRVNEEIDALETMGLDPIRFLVTTRVLAAVLVTPLLALFANFFGLLGGAVVFLSIGYSMVTYRLQVLSALDPWDLYGGLLKTIAFGFLVAGTGCLQGLRTGKGAAAVGLSTTRSVVIGIFLIIVADFLFSVVYYHLGI